MTRPQLTLPPVATISSAILSADILKTYGMKFPSQSTIQPVLLELYRQGFLRYNQGDFSLPLDTLKHQITQASEQLKLPNSLKKVLSKQLKKTHFYESQWSQLSPHRVSWFNSLPVFTHKNIKQKTELPIVETVVVLVRSGVNDILCISQEHSDKWFIPAGNKLGNESIIQASLRILETNCNITQSDFKQHIASVQNYSKINGFYHKTIEHYVELTISQIPKSVSTSQIISYQPLSLIRGQKWKQLNFALSKLDVTAKPVIPKILLASNNTFYETLSNTYAYNGDYLIMGGSKFVKDISYREYGHDERDNARLKAFTYFEKTGFPCIGMDIGLYFKGKAKKASPGVHIKRSARVNDADSDEQMAAKIINHYSNVVKTYSSTGTLPAEMVITFSYFDGHKYTDLQLTEKIVLSCSTHKNINVFAPLMTLMIDKTTGCHYYDSTSFAQSSWFTQLPKLTHFIDEIVNEKPLKQIQVIAKQKNQLANATSIFTNATPDIYFVNPHNSINVPSFNIANSNTYNTVRTFINTNAASPIPVSNIIKKQVESQIDWSISQSQPTDNNTQHFPFFLNNFQQSKHSNITYISTNSIKSKRFERNTSPLSTPISYINPNDFGVLPPEEHGFDIFENAEIKAKYYWNSLENAQTIITEDVSMIIGDTLEQDIPYEKMRQKVIDFYGSYSDDLMIQYYQDIVKKYKKPLPVRFEFAFCMYDGIRVQTAKAVSEIPLFIDKKRHSFNVDNFPISSLLYAEIDNNLISFSELSPAQVELIEKPLRNTIRPLIQQFSSHHANELTPLMPESLVVGNTTTRNRGGNALGEVVTGYVTSEFVTIFNVLMKKSHKQFIDWLVEYPHLTFKALVLGLVFREIGVSPKSFVVKK
jgi:inosine/xanthosine triphosphate pyrophosphatase family protein